MNFTSRQYSKYNSADSRRPDNSRRPDPFCPICKKNGRPESEYNSHFIRETSDENSAITCPILLSMECNHCGEKGHIVAKCPHKKCVYCNEFGHTVSRCTAAPKEVIPNPAGPKAKPKASGSSALRIPASGSPVCGLMVKDPPCAIAICWRLAISPLSMWISSVSLPRP